MIFEIYAWTVVTFFTVLFGYWLVVEGLPKRLYRLDLGIGLWIGVTFALVVCFLIFEKWS